MERTRTVREAIREELLRGSASAHDLSERISIPEKDVAGHLEHIKASARARGERLVVEPAACIACGYAFARRSRLTRPGSCPECGSTRIDAPAFRIESV